MQCYLIKYYASHCFQCGLFPPDFKNEIKHQHKYNLSPAYRSCCLTCIFLSCLIASSFILAAISTWDCISFKSPSSFLRAFTAALRCFRSSSKSTSISRNLKIIWVFYVTATKIHFHCFSSGHVPS